MYSEGYVTRELPWEEPLRFARKRIAADTIVVLLYSGLKTSYSGRFSFLALQPITTFSGADVGALREALSRPRSTFENAWFGYLGYEWVHSLESLPETPPSVIPANTTWLTQFAGIYVFDHERQTLTGYFHPSYREVLYTEQPSHALPGVQEIHSNMRKEDYLRYVGQLKEAIASGDCYQANLTRKFFGHFAYAPDAFTMYARLCEVSPAPYSAFIQTSEVSILSSSPEQFLHISESGKISTRPIKGTSRRFEDPARDRASLEALRDSEKDRAENLMIVDLMRNDLSRSAVSGSVEVHNLFEVKSFATVHHMDSTITARKQRDVSTLDVVAACFPPGSMTGAPKIRAMEWCHRLEGIQRGIYSGTIGWFGGDGSCDLSVVIRTLILKGNQFEFQVGGGIVADSDPEAEWEETMTKATGIISAIGLDETALRKL